MTVRSNQNSAFSLVEMMVVLTVVMVLLVLMVMPLLETARRASWNASCASNLNQIAVARTTFSGDHPDLELEAGDWNRLLEDYLGGKQEVLVCPEDDPAVGSIEGKMQVALWYRRLGGSPSLENCHAFSDLDNDGGLRVMKVSEKQIASGIRLPRQGENFWKANPTYKGYEPGTPDVAWRYWYNHDGPRSGDRDYNDTRIRVNIDGEMAAIDTWTEQAMINAGYYTWLVHKDNKANLLDGHPEAMRDGNIPPKWIRVQLPLHFSSYGMNWNTPELRGGGAAKIFAIDYEETVVRYETWDKWVDSNGVPTFARHPAGMLNVLYMDGSVIGSDPWRIDPQLVQNELSYWAP